MQNEFEIIINNAKEELRPMLRSVLDYNLSFNLDAQQKKLLKKILFSMSVVDRKFFLESNSYEDTAFSIGHGQTISQPSTVARMLMLLDLREGDDVLEIGTGSAWNACLLSLLVWPGFVHSIERISRLTEHARSNIKRFKKNVSEQFPEEYVKFSKLQLHTENIFEKRSSWAKRYDRIIFTAGISSPETEEKVDDIAQELLKEKGILICPYSYGPILIYKKDEIVKKSKTEEDYVFVKLT